MICPYASLFCSGHACVREFTGAAGPECSCRLFVIVASPVQRCTHSRLRYVSRCSGALRTLQIEAGRGFRDSVSHSSPSTDYWPLCPVRQTAHRGWTTKGGCARDSRKYFRGENSDEIPYDGRAHACGGGVSPPRGLRHRAGRAGSLGLRCFRRRSRECPWVSFWIADAVPMVRARQRQRLMDDGVGDEVDGALRSASNSGGRERAGELSQEQFSPFHARTQSYR
jgi:hypothetical protein